MSVIPLRVMLTLMCITLATNSFANCMANKFRGVNFAGAEFNSDRIPGELHVDYTYPKVSELQFSADKGANIVRLPLRWERLQPILNRELNKKELALVKQTVSNANAAGLCVLLDIHNYAEYRGKKLGTPDVPTGAFLDFWIRLAAEFDDPSTTIFGLMNEPANISIKKWSYIAQATVTKLRSRNVKNIIFVAGGKWSGVHDWFKSSEADIPNSEAFAKLHDPLGRTVIEMHQYFDDYYSGTTTKCHEPKHFTSMFENVANWARQNGFKLFLGEFGSSRDPACLLVLKAVAGAMENDAWLGWTYWAAGSWWGNYPFALNTDVAAPSPQWSILQPFFQVIKKPIKVELNWESGSTE